MKRNDTHPFDTFDKLSVFDRYAAFTDLEALKEASSRPLRKSVRVNTLKMSVDEFKKRAEEKGWQLEPVHWCAEGFFVDRVEREEALGKDLLHLLGHIYMQEAASMLPVELLDPQPGETVLDMSAAPGSKTTQIAAKMNGSGVLVANDMQEKRLWTLKTAIHRSGIINCIITKKKGQWFSKHMTERFDRVLCDAPCTAQGTARKDPTALDYTSDLSIKKMAKLQKDLLEAAVHAAKVGGRIVYSTCTLTPEENEEVVGWVLERFAGQVEVVEPREGVGCRVCGVGEAINDSMVVQKSLSDTPHPTPYTLFRLWPQTYDTEGFFCAVFQKNAPTRDREKMERVYFQEKPLPRSRQAVIAESLEEHFGTSFLQDGDALCERADQLLLATQEVIDFHLSVKDYSLGLPFAKGLKDRRTVRITNDLAMFRGDMATRNVCKLSDEQLKALLHGNDTECSEELLGDVILRWKDLNIGMGLAKEGKLKNRVSRWIVQQFQ